MGLINRERGGGGRGGAAQSLRRNYKSFKGINLTILERMHQFIVRGGRDGRGSSICATNILASRQSATGGRPGRLRSPLYDIISGRSIVSSLRVQHYNREIRWGKMPTNPDGFSIDNTRQPGVRGVEAKEECPQCKGTRCAICGQHDTCTYCWTLFLY